MAACLDDGHGSEAVGIAARRTQLVDPPVTDQLQEHRAIAIVVVPIQAQPIRLRPHDQVGPAVAVGIQNVNGDQVTRPV